MEGVTDPSFRQLVAARGGVGVLCTEFIRISQGHIPLKVLRRELGTWQEPCPIAVQFMAPSTDYLAESVALVEQTRAQYVDLNFGCPVKRVFNKCAGSALLDFPDRMFDIVKCAVEATGLPVTAKIRAGVNDTHLLKDVIHAVHSAGAALLAMHGRLRSESYAMDAHWEWLAEAQEYLLSFEKPIPFIANGGIDTCDDVDAVVKQTKCDGVMIGRGAIADPFIFRHYMCSEPATREEVCAFIVEYWQAINQGSQKKSGLGRIKQLLKYSVGNLLFDNEDQRQQLMRARDIETIWAYISGWTAIPA